MMILVEQVYEEVLRYVYVLSSARSPSALGAIVAVVVIAATRLHNPSPRTPRPATKVKAEA